MRSRPAAEATSGLSSAETERSRSSGRGAEQLSNCCRTWLHSSGVPRIAVEQARQAQQKMARSSGAGAGAGPGPECASLVDLVVPGAPGCPKRPRAFAGVSKLNRRAADLKHVAAVQPFFHDRQAVDLQAVLAAQVAHVVINAAADISA